MKELLLKLGACENLVEWTGNKSWPEIYKTCHRGDWLLWLFKKTNPDDIRKLTLAKGKCAETVMHLMKDERSINAVKIAIAFGEGNATRDELNAAANSAATATADADVDYTTVCADTYAAVCATAAADAAADTYCAAYVAYVACAAFTSFTARAKNQKLTADICREVLPIEIWNISNS